MAIDGDWKLVLDTPIGQQEAALTIKSKSATAFDGTMSGDAGRQSFEGAIDGDILTWQTDITTPMPLSLEFTVTVVGEAMTGAAKLGTFGTAPVTGSRA